MHTAKNKLKEREEICNDHDSYHTEMPRQAPFAIYLNLGCLLKKNNLAKIIPKHLTQRNKLYMSLMVG